jgi:hypothetical protein
VRVPRTAVDEVRRRSSRTEQLRRYTALGPDQDESLSLNYYSSLKGGKYSSKGTKPRIQKESASDNTSKMKDENTGNLLVNTRLQELEAQLMREKESKQCVVCLDRPRMMMMRPCNHYCICEECSMNLSRCPICTKRFIRMEKIYNV